MPSEPPPLADCFTVDITVTAEEAVVVVHGDIDIATGPPLWAAVERATRHAPRRLVLDLADVGFTDSTCIRTILRGLQRLATPSPSGLVVRSPGPAARRLFTICDMVADISIEDPAELARTTPQ